MNRRIPNGTYWWCERSVDKIIVYLLLDYKADFIKYRKNIKSAVFYNIDEIFKKVIKV
ncbi:hypothetical protein CNEO4_650001 [Clostridium neonatale]|nr:hypothetical protein CNEO4_640001 [Clostridium neonatale]CAI3698596.1 hypothetical protein CNEO4_650001 [Clostridium neonatale]